MLDWLRRRRPQAIPEPLWQDVLQRFPFLAAQAAEALPRLRDLTGMFLATKEFHGAHGFAITDSVAVSIAAQAVLPLLRLEPSRRPAAALHWYDDFVGVVVHRAQVLARRTVTDENGIVHSWKEVLAGEAMDGGPVMLNWQDVDAAGATAEQGFNVVIHEFIHKIDLKDGMADGCPPLGSHARRDWLEAIGQHYQAFREQVIQADRFGGEPPWLDAYGAESVDEFFAVAAEAYFVNRGRFTSEFPRLLALFDGFFML